MKDRGEKNSNVDHMKLSIQLDQCSGAKHNTGFRICHVLSEG